MSESLGATPFDFLPSSPAPLQQWLDDVRRRVEGWSRGVQAISVQEWKRLQGAVSGLFSAQRVEQVLRDLLSRRGVARSDQVARELMMDLRLRVLRHGLEETIESYPRYLSSPPQIRL